MSISTSLTNLNLVYPSTSSDNQWNQDFNVPRNEQQFIVNEQYNVNPVSSGSSTYTNPKIPNMNCPTGQMNFNPPSYSSYNPNGLNGQDIRFQNTYNTRTSGVMFHSSRATQFMPGPSTSYSPARRIVSRPTWSTSKSTSGGVKKTKRIRTAFTSQQMMELENEYARARYLDRSRRIELSEVLKLHERTIKIWFQNRRMKEKKDKNEAAEEAEATSTTESSPEIAAPMIMYDPYANNGVGFDRNVYVEQYPVPSMAHNDVPSVVENIANLHINPYPAFVVENNVPVSDFDMQCRQINMQMQNYSIDDKDDAFQQETLEESSTSENSTIGTSKNSDESENWDLSWIRSIHIDDDA